MDLPIELSNELTCVYGRAATGKTTLAMNAAIEYAKRGKKVLYIDTEGGFNIERFRQIAGADFDSLVEHIIILRVKTFGEQCDKINWLKEEYSQFGLVILDTIGHYYRRLVHENPKDINKDMAMMIARLARMSKDIPVLILNQVYDKVDSNEVSMVGGKLMTEKCPRIIELANINSKRKILMKKPAPGERMFKIEDKGIILLDQ